MKETTPQQILQESQEEFQQRFHELVGYVFDEETKLHLINKNEELSNKILSWHISTLQAFIEAEIASEKKRPPFTGHVGNDTSRAYDMGKNEGYNQAKEETITHLKELLVTLKR